MKLKTKYFLLLICSLFFLKAEAKVTLTSIWGDNMVLQQQSEVTFYGKASPGKRVYVSASWNNRKISTVSNQDGRWELVLPTPEAGGPYTITFSDGEELMLKNILIGEVWFCSGQSNMEMPVNVVFTLVLAFVLLLLLSLSTIVSGFAEKLKRLAQENALLEKRVRELEQALAQRKDGPDETK